MRSAAAAEKKINPVKDAVMNLAQVAVDIIWDCKTHLPATSDRPRLVAHRGAWNSSTHIENTLHAFKRALELGAWAIECDLRFTKDDVPVINHDPDLRRYHLRSERIADLSFAELRALAPAVPALDEVLTLINSHLMIEVKTAMSPVQQQILIRHLSRLQPVRDYHFLALQSELVRIHSAMPEPAWMLVGEINLNSFVKTSLDRGYCGVAGHYLGMTNKCAAQLRANNQKTGVGFIPTKNLFNREHCRGIDWVFTNHLSDLI